MPLAMQALSNKFGVAITGVDLSKELDEKLFNEIVDVFVKGKIQGQTFASRLSFRFPARHFSIQLHNFLLAIVAP